MKFYGWFHLLGPYLIWIPYPVVSWNLLMDRYWNSILLIIRLMHLALSVYQVSGFLLCPLRLMRLCSLLSLELIYTLCALRRFDCFFICDHSGQSRWTFLWHQSTSESPPYFLNLPWLVFGFPLFRSCFPGYPGLPKESASLRSIFTLIVPSLVRLYITTANPVCQALF